MSIFLRHSSVRTYMSIAAFLSKLRARRKRRSCVVWYGGAFSSEIILFSTSSLVNASRICCCCSVKLPSCPCATDGAGLDASTHRADGRRELLLFTGDGPGGDLKKAPPNIAGRLRRVKGGAGLGMSDGLGVFAEPAFSSPLPESSGVRCAWDIQRGQGPRCTVRPRRGTSVFSSITCMLAVFLPQPHAWL